MGDTVPQGGFTESGQDSIHAPHKQSMGTSPTPHQPDPRSASGTSPFYSQLPTLPHQHPSHLNAPATIQRGTYSPSPGVDLGASAYNMSSMAGALPHYGIPGPRMQQPQGIQGASPSAVAYDLQHIPQYPGQPPSPYSPVPVMPGQYPNSYVPAQVPQNASYGVYATHEQRPYVNYTQQTPPQYAFYYPNQFGPPQHMAPQHYGQQGRGSSMPPGQVPVHSSGTDASIYGTNYGQPTRITGGPVFAGEANVQGGYPQLGALRSAAGSSPDVSMGSTPRGPPRKPKQSGHALWVGNLPPGTTVIDLKDHFSRDATKDIESLFLISKSNCAFVNYRTEASCTAAMHRFHDSRFKGVRLVCRLRRSPTPSSGVPTAPSAMTDARPPSAEHSKSPDIAGEAEEEGEEQATKPQTADGMVDGESSTSRLPEKFFVVKSLTMQDLEQSVRTGIWATQSHNEEALNNAYETADNVYLIFSANKSGEYFGYARMTSPISSEFAHLVEPTPQTTTLEPSDAPKSIPTPASEFAPKGRIIDDSARGTIFWEAELSDADDDDHEGKEEADDDEGGGGAKNPGLDPDWGKPFKIEWLSTNRLPFFKTRGLRNPWNANREVKIARDGTQLETSVGRRLVQMFPRGHQMPPAGAPAVGGGGPRSH